MARLLPETWLKLGLAAVLSIGHLILCIIAQVDPMEGWAWVIVTMLDFPVSMIILGNLNHIPPLLSLGVLGSIWWGVIGWGLGILVPKIAARR